MLSTALIIRYSAFALYLISFVYALAIALPLLKNKSSDVSESGESDSLSELMSEISKWSDTSDAYEDSPEHSRRVADMARQIGEKYGLPKEDLEALECAALLHDVGQINNFDFIKEDRALTIEEKTRLEEHPILGEQLAVQIANIGSAPLWVRWHHERWDGCGYPDQLSGEMIPISARILAICDSYDALTHQRPYRRAISPEDAMKELQKLSGIVFDPNIVQVFMSLDSDSEIGSSLEV